MPLLVGIDEAGYGPLLGPLVVAATVWQAAPAAARDDHWKRLEAVISRRTRRSDARLAVDDSKRLYSRLGIAGLERTVLAFAAVAGLPTDSAERFIDALGGLVPGPELPPPWYQDLAFSLPIDPHRGCCDGIARRLAESFPKTQMRCCALLAEIVPENVFNRRVCQTKNKAVVLIEHVLRLIYRASALACDQDVYVFVDRLGGRQDYRAALLQAFPQRHLHEVLTSVECSRYLLADRRSDWWVEFRVDADSSSLPVALASMLAKYVRELLMRSFNAYWRRFVSDLRPTAGYYQDALRFLGQIRPVLPIAQLKPEYFVRQR